MAGQKFLCVIVAYIKEYFRFSEIKSVVIIEFGCFYQHITAIQTCFCFSSHGESETSVGDLMNM